MKCPVCKAANDQGPQCRRCRADLSLLFGLEEQRQHALAEACRSAVRGHLRRALAIAEGADALRSDQDSQRLLMAVRLLRRDYGGAWRDYVSR
ncbi:MAG TPA: hypothetical protein VG013_14715 [Gemmataceae bacterium]|jgi:hypothetical protein|nr:hypothetical protein [Gemmataceae bacterium]